MRRDLATLLLVLGLVALAFKGFTLRREPIRRSVTRSPGSLATGRHVEGQIGWIPPLTINGVSLGMTVSEVHEQLGAPPWKSGCDWEYPSSRDGVCQQVLFGGRADRVVMECGDQICRAGRVLAQVGDLLPDVLKRLGRPNHSDSSESPCIRHFYCQAPGGGLLQVVFRGDRGKYKLSYIILDE